MAVYKFNIFLREPITLVDFTTLRNARICNELSRLRLNTFSKFNFSTFEKETYGREKQD